MTSVSLPPWQEPPPHVCLDGQTVHLWRFRLDLCTDDLDRLKPLLNPAEQARAARLLDPLKAARFVAARGRLRQVLARYLEMRAGQIEFAYGGHGKPRLTGACSGKLTFNLSHAGCWGVLVVSKEFEVGVDIEQIDRQLEYEKVVTRYFTAAEIGRLENCSAGRRRRAFFRIWTRKEAWLKKQGSGFVAARLHSPEAEGDVRSFVLDRDFLGAVAVEGPATSLQRWDLKSRRP